MFRVYDLENKKWASSEVVMFRNTDLAEIKKGFFGKKYSIRLMSDKKSTFQNSIDCYDSEGVMIFEGDILQSPDGITGLVHYAEENASYILIDYDTHKYYPLGKDICSKLKIVGNVLENKNLLGKEYSEDAKKYEEQSLSKSQEET